MFHASISNIETTLELRTVLDRKLRNYLISASVKNRTKNSVYVNETS